MARTVILAVNNMIFTSKIMSVLDNLEAEGIKAIRSNDIFAKAQEMKPDLIIMDLNLNGIEAPSLINKLRSSGLDPGVNEEIEKSFDRLINKLLHPPLSSLRDDAAEGHARGLLEALRHLFNLGDD